MRKTNYIFLFLFLLLACLPISSYAEKIASSSETIKTSAIQPLTVIRRIKPFQEIDGIKPFEDYWCQEVNIIDADLSREPGFVYSLTIGDKTKFTKNLPAGYDLKKLIEWGKYSGLNMDILHKHGFTGKGAVIAYIDQPILEHEQYTRNTVYHVNNKGAGLSMHGPAVLSLLTGKDIGTAPEAEIYYWSWTGPANFFQKEESEYLYQIIEKNKTLPENKKIRMVGFSSNILSDLDYTEMKRSAVKACKDAGIMVWFCGEYGSFSFIPYSDRNSFISLVPDSWFGNNTPKLVCVPCASRTTAATIDGVNYIYWAQGGLSWAMPYMLGLYDIAIEIDPSLTQDDLRKMIVETAYNNGEEVPVVNPVGFVAAVLKKVGRDAEAEIILDEVKARTKYLYAVMNTKEMTENDLTALGEYLSFITDATVLTVDTSKYTDRQSLCSAIKQDAKQRGGMVVGVQVFGTPDATFGLITKNQISEWPVARLPLKKSEFETFFKKYKKYIGEISVIKPNLVAMAFCDSEGYINKPYSQIKKIRRAAGKTIPFNLKDLEIKLTDGNSNGDIKDINYSIDNRLSENKAVTIHSFVAQPLDNGYIRFNMEYSVPEKMRIMVLEPPEALIIHLWKKEIPSGKGELVFDVSNEDIEDVSEINCRFFIPGTNNEFVVLFKTDQLKNF